MTFEEEKNKKPLITKQRKGYYTGIKIGNHATTSKHIIKYLEIMVRPELSYKQHVDNTSHKTSPDKDDTQSMRAPLYVLTGYL